MSQDENTVPFFHNVFSALTYLFYVAAIIVLPILFIRSIIICLATKDKNEKRCRLFLSLELFGYCYSLYGLLLIPVLHNVFEEWWIWSYFPTIWGAIAGYPESDLIMGVFGDAFTCILLAPIFGFIANRYGSINDNRFIPR
jgi:hypothetical protein